MDVIFVGLFVNDVFLQNEMATNRILELALTMFNILVIPSLFGDSVAISLSLISSEINVDCVR